MEWVIIKVFSDKRKENACKNDCFAANMSCVNAPVAQLVRADRS